MRRDIDMKKDIYINSPLKEVVFEIRFPGCLSIETKKDIFYDKFKIQYPNIYVPRVVNPGVAIALEPYRFEKEDGSSGIMLSINKVGYFCKKYKGFKYFKKEVINIYSHLQDIFKINKINRIGLRYINIIPFLRENDLIPVNKFLNIDLNISNKISNEIHNLSLVMVSKIPTGSITTKIESFKTINNQEAILLDFDYAVLDNPKPSNIGKILNKSHKEVHEIFESIITSEYRKFINGEFV